MDRHATGGRFLAGLARTLIALVLAFAALQSPANAQAPAMLPTENTVAAGEPLAIDGVWKVRGLQKDVRIERGRIYALESWVHAFIFTIQPGMVTARDIQHQSLGVYAGNELSLASRVTYRLQRDGSIVATTASLIPATFIFDPVRLDFPGVYAIEIVEATGAEPDAILARLN